MKMGYNLNERMYVSMKKFGKFLFTVASLAAIAGGAYYFLKNVVNKDSKDEFDDFDDDFDDFDEDDESVESTESREYVTININDEAKTASTTEENVTAQEATTEEIIDEMEKDTEE